MRKVVLGIDADGRSAATSDEPPRSVFVMDSFADRQSHDDGPARSTEAPSESDLTDGAWAVVELWSSDPNTLAYGQADPTVGADWKPRPGPGSSMWRHAVWAPGFSAPMHQTETLDYDTVLSGQVYLIHDNGETLLQQGDVAVIPGTSHGWRTDTGCTLGCVMIGLPPQSAGE